MDPHPLHDPEFDPYQPPASGQLRRRRPELEPLSGLRVAATYVVVLISCLVAFVGTCAPMSLILARKQPEASQTSFSVPLLMGYLAVTFVGFGLTKVLNSFHRRPINPHRPDGEKPR